MKSNKIYIVAAVVLLVGLAFMFSGAASAGFSTARLSADDWQDKTYTAAGDITALVIDDSNTAVEIVPTDEERVAVAYTDGRWQRYAVEEANGALRVEKRTEPRDWFRSLWSFDFGVRRLTVRVPRGTALTLDAGTSNASVTLSGLSLAKLSLRTSNARVEVRDVTVAQGMEVKSSNGGVSLTDVTAQGDVAVTTSNDTVALDGLTARTVDVKTSNGPITLDAVDGRETLRFESSNGSITGSLAGAMKDYSIESHTSNGSSNLPEELGLGGRSLTVRTSNDRIDVGFAED